MGFMKSENVQIEYVSGFDMQSDIKVIMQTLPFISSSFDDMQAVICLKRLAQEIRSLSRSSDTISTFICWFLFYCLSDLLDFFPI